MRGNFRTRITALCVVAAGAVTLSCGQMAMDAGDDDSADDNSSGGGSIGDYFSDGADDVLKENNLALAIPTSLALSVFPESQSLSLSGAQAQSDGDNPVEDPNASQDTRKKIEGYKDKIKGTADECIDLRVLMPRLGRDSVTCYEFDSDMNPRTHTGPNNETFNYGTIDGTDGNGEACMVAFARKEIEESVEVVDNSMEVISGLLCQAKKDGLDTVLEVGEDLDLKDALQKALGQRHQADAAVIERLADSDDEFQVYKTDVKITFADGRSVTLIVRNATNSDGEQKGTLSFSRRQGTNTAGLNNNDQNKDGLMSINYHRYQDDDDEPRIRFEARFARMVRTIEPFDDAGLVNFAALPETAQNATVHAIKYVASDSNPETSEGQLSYWMNPGGNLIESARGFLFSIEADEEGSLSGCGVSGATANLSIRKAVTEPSDDNTLKPVRYWHPFGAQNNHVDRDTRYSGQEGNYVTRQCFVVNEEGKYVIDTSKITSERGYEVDETAAVEVIPPRRPAKKLEAREED